MDCHAEGCTLERGHEPAPHHAANGYEWGSVHPDRLIVGRTVSLETRGGRTYIHPRARILRPRGKQETPDYVDPFDVDADWNERA